MTLRRLLSCLFLTPCVIVSSAAAQSDSHRIDLLLQRESEALAHYQQRVAPAIRCDYADKDVRQTCNDMLTKVRDEAQQAKHLIAAYRTSGNRQPTALFDIYVDLQSLLQNISVLGIEDEFWGNRNREPLAAGYNSFIKLTAVWFTSEMRETIRDLGPR